MADGVNSKPLGKIHLIEKVCLENGYQQWLLETNNDFKIKPGTTLILDGLKLPVLWQPANKTLLCLYFGGDIGTHKTHWQDYSFISSPVKQHNIKDAELTLILCKNSGFYHALHQLYQWRQQKQLPANLLVLSETQPKPPFKLQPSRIFCSLLPVEATATIALLDDWGIAAGLVNRHWQPGCFEGTLAQLESFVVSCKKISSTSRLYFGYQD